MGISSVRKTLLLAAASALLAAPAAWAQTEPAAPAADAEQPAAGGEADRGAPLPPDPTPEPARIKLSLRGVQGGSVAVGGRFSVFGRIEPFVRDQRVTVIFRRYGKVLKKRTVAIKRANRGDAGRFELASKRMIKPGSYRFRAVKRATPEQQAAEAHTRGVKVRYPDLDPGDSGKKVKLFNRLLKKKAYYTARSRRYGSATGRAVLAYRKVHGMARTQNATRDMYRTLAAGKGGFHLKWPEGGKHIEADLSRQVMVLARGGKAQHIFHISSGAPATPTVRGKYATYRKDYGTNSLGMVHSVYFHRGYATHGYHSVPTYPASHGCLRNPIPNAKFIYDWIDLGDVFYVYR